MSMTILRLPEVIHRTGLSRSTIYSQIAAGDFPRQIHLGSRSIGWIEDEIDRWIQARVVASRMDKPDREAEDPKSTLELVGPELEF